MPLQQVFMRKVSLNLTSSDGELQANSLTGLRVITFSQIMPAVNVKESDITFVLTARQSRIGTRLVLADSLYWAAQQE